MTDLVTLSLRVTGVDLDDKLIQVAHRNARVFANGMFGVHTNCIESKSINYNNNNDDNNVYCTNYKIKNDSEADVQLCFMCADARVLPPTSQLFDRTAQITQTNCTD